MTATERHPIDELVEEFLDRRRRGDAPTMQEYLRRYPEFAADIKDLFPAMFLMEGARRQSETDAPRLERLGDYRIVGEIGRGGMGVVYEAVQESLGRRVALKVLPRNGQFTPKLMQRFRREARAAARLHHSNIVPIHSVEHHADLDFFVMQLIDGRGLDRLFSELRRERHGPSEFSGDVDPRADTYLLASPSPTSCGPRPPTGVGPAPVRTGAAMPAAVHPDRTPTGYWRRVARIGAEAAEALDYAHRQGVLHRDVKPANLLLDSAGVTWVVDFGLAKLLNDHDTDEDGQPPASLTGTGDVLGTVRYMAPERFNGQADQRSDVYSLGLTLYEMLSLRYVFDAPDRPGAIHQVLHDDPPALRKVDPRIPADLATIVTKAIEKDPRRRYATAGQFAADLRRFLDGRPVKARPIRLPERAWRWGRRNPRVAALLGVIVLVTGIGFAAVWHQRDEALRNGLAARQERDRTRTANDRLQKTAHQLRLAHHAAYIQLAGNAWQSPDGVRRCRELLYGLVPWNGETDLRGFEWYYLDRLCHPDRRVMKGHTSGIRSLACSRDGSRFASLSSDGNVRVWDAAAGVELRSWQAHGGTAVAVAFSPDGKHLATAGRETTGGPGGFQVRFWDAVSGTLVHTVAPDRDFRVFSMHYSPDGERLVLGGGNYHGSFNNYVPRLTVLAVKTGRELLAVVDRGFLAAPSSDGSRLAVKAADGSLKILDANTGADLVTLEAQRWTHAMVWSPDGRLVAAGHARGITIWDAATGEIVGRSSDQKADVRSLHFSPDGRRLAAGSQYDSVIRIHDVPTGQELYQFRGHDGLVSGVQFTPDGRSVVSSSADRTLAVWPLAAPGPSILHSPDKGSLERLAVNADASRLVTHHISTDPASGRVLRTVRGWDAAADRVVWSVPGYGSSRVAATADGDRVVTWQDHGEVSIRDLATGKAILRFDEPSGQLREVFQSADGRTVVCVRGRTATVRDGRTGVVEREIRLDETSAQHAALSPDGRRLAIAAGDPTGKSADFGFEVYSVETGRRLATARGCDGGHMGLLSLEFSPNGRRLVTTHSTEARIWDAETGAEQLTLRGHSVLVRSATFSPDGRRLATAGFDQAVKLWDLETGQELLTLRGQSLFHSVAFDADGSHLAAGCGSHVVLWDARPMPPATGR